MIFRKPKLGGNRDNTGSKRKLMEKNKKDYYTHLTEVRSLHETRIEGCRKETRETT